MLQQQYAPTNSLRLHPKAFLVPPMGEQDFADLTADIRVHGIQKAVDVDGATVLDGRNRLKIAKLLRLPRVPVEQVTLNGESPTAYMLRMALLRRHLTDDQRAAMAALWKQEHARTVGRPHTNSHAVVGISEKVPALEVPKLFNITRRKLDEATYLLNRVPVGLQAVHAGTLKLRELKREVYLADQRMSISNLTAPRGRFSVIVVDPPWPYQKREGDVTKRGAIPYPPMSIEAIQALEIPATDNCIVWLCTTNAFMHEAYHVLESWGFEAKTILSWVKNRMGVGDWLRGKTEHCILAIRGRPMVTLTNQTTVLYGDRQNHSQKPEEFFSLVESLCPARPKLAMFFDIQRIGWQCYGVQQRSSFDE